MNQYNHARAYAALMPVTGEVVNITNGYGILSLNASGMNNGTYLMQLSLNGEVVATEKFIILK